MEKVKKEKKICIAMISHKRVPSREGGVEVVVEELGSRMVDMYHIFTCTDAKYKSLCLEQISGLSEKNIIVESIARNTEPCILSSTRTLSKFMILQL